MIRAFLIVLVVCAIPRVSAAQGLFLQKGTSGYGGQVGFATDGGSLSFGGDAGYSYQGWLDGNVAVYQTSLDSAKTGGYELKEWSIMPRGQVHLLKQSDTMPLSVAVAGGIGLFSIVGDSFTDSGMSMGGWAARASTTVYRFFKLGAAYGVIPGLELAYGHTETTLDSPYGTLHSGDDRFSVALGGHVAFLLETDYIFTITPVLAIDHEGTASFSLMVGMLRAKP